MPVLHLCRCGVTIPRTGRCHTCEPERSRERRATSHAVRARDSLAWQHARAQARARDGGCVYRQQGGCSGALAVHHRVPLEQGGTNALDNLLTLCRAHHEQAERAAREER